MFRYAHALEHMEAAFLTPGELPLAHHRETPSPTPSPSLSVNSAWLASVPYAALASDPCALEQLGDELCRRFFKWPTEAQGPDHTTLRDPVQAFQQLLGDPESVGRSRRPHITTSCLLLSEDHAHTTLVLHRKRGEWFYPGGHPDGEWNWLASAVRECREETSVADLRLILSPEDLWPLTPHVPLELSGSTAEMVLPKLIVHHEAGAHDHLDFVYVLETSSRLLERAPEEALDCRWFSMASIRDNCHGEALLSPDSRAVILAAKDLIKPGDSRVPV